MGKETAKVDEIVIIDQQDRILHQLEEMFEIMPLSDVTFNILGRKFAAHKNILTMRSPVFAAMFRHPTKEMQSNQVEVKDVDPDVFSRNSSFYLHWPDAINSHGQNGTRTFGRCRQISNGRLENSV
jgi:hypothetical protein